MKTRGIFRDAPSGIPSGQSARQRQNDLARVFRRSSQDFRLLATVSRHICPGDAESVMVTGIADIIGAGDAAGHVTRMSRLNDSSKDTR